MNVLKASEEYFFFLFFFFFLHRCACYAVQLFSKKLYRSVCQRADAPQYLVRIVKRICTKSMRQKNAYEIGSLWILIFFFSFLSFFILSRTSQRAIIRETRVVIDRTDEPGSWHSMHAILLTCIQGSKRAGWKSNQDTHPYEHAENLAR